ncbi:aldehyde dehydrogenase family protein [Tetragenococcus muriaticus PMC-11-5]|uniref:Aldehyde dehydrogenase family protein n=3 Tax=Tetragenococcus muriaticus TaxID=64642 RepID=A0A091C208_9ENTE|nr:aldehyde dehydrogenase family protein [Tetragenococcus muriaticus 3MR10-3]KFN91462.1 aldehyde dehydrogenase family protein [Tetragenococcus muriaticus PMC-11-5]
MQTYDKLFYNGQWQDAQSNDYSDIINTANEEVIAKVVKASHQDVDQAVASAKAAFDQWNNTSPETRAKYIEKIADGIEKRQDEIADTMVEELGTSKAFADKG